MIREPKSCHLDRAIVELWIYEFLAQSQTISAKQGFFDVSKWANYLLFETISAEKGLYEQIINLLNLTYNKHTNNQRILKEKLYVIYINCLGHFNLMIRSNMTKRFTKLTEEKFETYYVPLLVKRVGAMNKMHLLRKNTHLIPKNGLRLRYSLLFPPCKSTCSHFLNFRFPLK